MPDEQLATHAPAQTPGPEASNQPPTVLEFTITGMTCAGCSSRVEKAIKATSGVLDGDVNLSTEQARVFVGSPDFATNLVIESIEGIGFGASLKATDEIGGINDDVFEDQSRKSLITAAFALTLTAPIVAQMFWMLAGYGAFLTGWHQFILALLVQFIAGARFYRPAWFAAKDLSGNMDLLVVSGTLAAFGLSVFNLLRGEGDLYFEASASVISLVLLGKWMEARAKRSATSALRGLMKLRPDTVRVKRQNDIFEIPLNQLRTNDLFVVRPGERVPADGIIEEGTAAFDMSMMSGESLPVTHGPGDSVTGGITSTDGLLNIRATAVGDNTVLARIISIVDQAQSNKAPIQRIVDKIAAVFVPIVLAIAVVTFVVWLIIGVDASTALINAVTVLVVACPCALGLATPTAITVGTGVAARHGILIRDLEALERSHAINAVVFDKTGTLTTGEPAIIDIQSGEGVSQDDMMSLAASTLQDSAHPLAMAITAYVREQCVTLLESSDFTNISGKGVHARINDQTVFVGNAAFLKSQGIELNADNLKAGDDIRPSTAVWVGSSSQLLGVFRLSDEIRPDSAEAIKLLKAANIKPTLLSGDNTSVVTDVAARLGIETASAEVLPEDKAKYVSDLQQQGYMVAMVGDGINDAPALATADIAIAMGGGSDIAIDTASIALIQPSPLRVVDAISISKATYAKIKQNLFWAFVYNVFALPLAASGQLTPIIAGAAMALSSVSVVSNSLLLRRWRPHNRKSQS